MINKKANFIGYVITLTALMLTASPFFTSIDVRVKFTFTMIILVYAFLKGKLRNSRSFILILIAVYCLIIVQIILYGGFSPAGIYKPILIFLTPFVLYRLLGLAYFKYLFWIIYYGAVFTFPLWLLQNLLPAFDSLLQKYIEIVFTYNWDAWPRSLLFYTVSIKYPGELINALGLLRNSGFFHEPGAFSLYLMLAIIINTFFTRNTLDKKNIILAIILLTTFSTAGYIILALFLAYAIPKSKMHPVLKYLVLFIMILVTINTYRTEDFLKSKIEEHYSTQVESIQENEVSGGRFYSFLKAYEVIKQYPVFGKGIITKNRPVEEGAYYDWGPMGLFANYGIIFGFIYLLFYYKGLEKLRLLFGLPKGIAILFLIIIQAGLSTQAFFFHASFVMFFIIGLESNVNPRASIIPEKPMAYKTPIVSKGI